MLVEAGFQPPAELIIGQQQDRFRSTTSQISYPGPGKHREERGAGDDEAAQRELKRVQDLAHSVVRCAEKVEMVVCKGRLESEEEAGD